MQCDVTTSRVCINSCSLMHKESREGRVFITGNKGDGKFTLKQAMKTQTRIRGTAVPFLSPPC